MFLHKKTEANWPMIIFGIIVLAVVILTIGVLIMLAGKVKNKDFGKSQKSGDVTFEINTRESVNNNYNKEILVLKEKLEKAEDFTVALEEVKPAFFAVRVPQEKLDDHLAAFLRLQGLDKSKDKREEAVELLDGLID